MNAQHVWQAQLIEAPRMSLAYVRHAASDFDRRRRLRAALSYGICIATCGFLGFTAWAGASGKPLMLAGLACFALFMLYAAYRLHRHVTLESSPADAGVFDTLRYQRRQLERQRDWRRGSWRLILPAVLPGYALELASMYFEIDPVPWKSMGFVVLTLIMSVGLTAWSGERQARSSQREIDALDSLADDPGASAQDG